MPSSSGSTANDEAGLAASTSTKGRDGKKRLPFSLKKTPLKGKIKLPLGRQKEKGGGQLKEDASIPQQQQQQKQKPLGNIKTASRGPSLLSRPSPSPLPQSSLPPPQPITTTTTTAATTATAKTAATTTTTTPSTSTSATTAALPQDPPTLQSSLLRTSSSIENIPDDYSGNANPEVEVVLSYTAESRTPPSSPPAIGGDDDNNDDDGAMMGDNDNAFLKALRGSTSMDDGDEDAAAAAAATAVGSNAEADKNAFLKNLRTNEDNAFLSAFHGASSGDHHAGQKASSTDALASSITDSTDTRGAADNAFLSAFRGDTSGDEDAGAVSTADDSGRGAADNAFLSAFRGESSGGAASTPSAKAGRNEADNSFLSNFHGGGGGGDAVASTTRSDADNDFLSAFREASVNPTATLTKSPRQGFSSSSSSKLDGNAKATTTNNADASFLANVHGPSTEALPGDLTAHHSNENDKDNVKGGGGGEDSMPKDEMANANAAFLGALKASSDPADDVPVTATPKMRTNKKRVQPPVQRGSQPKAQHAANDSDSQFLMAVRGSSSQSSFASSGFVGDGGGGGGAAAGYDSGTLVLNSPVKLVVDEAEGSSNEAFMRAIHDSAEDQVGNDGAILSGAEGENNNNNAGNATSAGNNGAKGNIAEEVEEDENIEEEDIEGLKIPQHPYMEKVFLPRPLFFGHALPPRVLEEAKRVAASISVAATNDASEAMENEEAPPPPPLTELTLSQADTESTAGDDSSVVSKSSASSFATAGGAGAKRFGSSIAPCYRNLEGAMEAFGFGFNPFSAQPAEDDDDEEEEQEPPAPHPYVSLYSPVWEEWSREARAKARKRKARTAPKEEAIKQPAVPAPVVIKKKKNKRVKPPVTRANKPASANRLHKKSMSMDFVDCLRESIGEPPLEQHLESIVGSVSEEESPRHQRKKSPSSPVNIPDGDTASLSSMESSKISTDDQFLRFARAGAGPSPPPEDDDNKDTATNDFLKFARAGTADVGGEDETSNSNADAATNDFLKFARAGTADVDDKEDENSKANAATNDFLKFARAGTADVDDKEDENSNTNAATNDFLKFARAGTADVEDEEDKNSNSNAATNDFLKFARAGTADVGDEDKDDNNNDDGATNDFLKFARAGTTDVPDSGTNNNTDAATNDFLKFARAGTADVPDPRTNDADAATNDFLKFARAGTADIGEEDKGGTNNDDNGATNDFLKFARAGTTDIPAAGSFDDGNNNNKNDADNGNGNDSATNDFLKFARAGTADDASGTFVGQAKPKAKATPSPKDGGGNYNGSDFDFLKFARGGATDDTGSAGTFVGKSSKPPQSKDSSSSNDFSQDSFLKYARAGAGGGEDADAFADAAGTFVASPPANNNNANRGGGFSVPMDSSTFVSAVKSSESAQSDDDSIEAAEERMAVGLNDNISAAAAMLAGGGADADADVDENENEGLGHSVLLAAGGGSKAANAFGRPYSNFELTRGCVPRFGCDDPSLPHESDLGVFETKEEEKRNNEMWRQRKTIEDHAVPGIMPHLACPSHCSDVDDGMSWNSRASGDDGNVVGGSGGKGDGANTMLISLDGGAAPGRADEAASSSSGSQRMQPKSTLYETSRIAWWNLPNGFDESPPPINNDARGGNNSGNNNSKGGSNIHRKASKAYPKRPHRAGTSSSAALGPTPEVFPASDDPVPLDVQTNLWPPLSLLRENNMSGTRSHSATSAARYLPHLSDRAPDARHLQIDATAVGFPKAGGEIEPMFCGLAIYNFEMGTAPPPPPSSSGSSPGARSGNSSVDTGGSFAPSPDMERCGRVTETLHFDVAQDSDVIRNCRRALWPYGKFEGEGGNTEPGFDSNGPLGADAARGEDGAPQSEGTSCGIFPLPANLSITNLYAVILVHKVISENPEGSLQPYYKPERSHRHHHRQDSTADAAHREENGLPDLRKLREAAKVSSEKYGHFTAPFCFGVVPLKHIIGDESPKVPVSRAVQIPLFKYDAERGPQTIYDHILLMLHPRAEPRGGKAASTTRGHALLVMRYFGYLGLHTILKKKSSLSRERLVDFTGELQVKCKDGKTRVSKERCPALGEDYVLSPWRNQYLVEPAAEGGRNVTGDDGSAGATAMLVPVKREYAQEIAALPLKRSNPDSSSRSPSSSRSKSSHSNRTKYDGMLIHRSFCNELICRPTVLQKCARKNVMIKVELRELRYDQQLNVDVAMPATNPSIHNTRRGPWLVREAYTSCALGAPQFLDEFKLKLPLVLGGTGASGSSGRYGLLFTVYQFNNNNDGGGDNAKGRKNKRRLVSRQGVDDSKVKLSSESSGFVIERLGCGFLPLTLENSPTCLIANGDHEVPVEYRAVRVAHEKDKANLSSPLVPEEQQKSPPQRTHKKKFSFGDGVASIGGHMRSWSSSSINDALQLSQSIESTKSENQDVEDSPLFTNENYPEGSLALTKLERPQITMNVNDDDTVGSTVNGEDEDSKSSRHTDVVSTGGGSTATNKPRRISSVGDLKQLLQRDTSTGESTAPSDETINDMILEVNVIAFTSVHPQNRTLADLFLSKPKMPRALNPSDFAQPYAPWGKYRSEITYRLKPERIPPFHFVGGTLAETERKLLEPVVGLTKSSKCPHSDLMSHLVRVVGQLWRTAVSGAGEPSILWASPESLIPLRLNAFATLLHTVSSASHHMTKAGLKQLDGNATWDISALGKILSMLFDEYAILGGPLEDTQHLKKPDSSSGSSSPQKSPVDRPDIMSNRSKSTAGSGSFSSRPSIIERYSSEESPRAISPEKKKKEVQTFDIDAMLSHSVTNPPVDSIGSSASAETSEDDSFSTDLSSLTSGESGFKVDSKSDFMSSLTASLDNDNAAAAPAGEDSDASTAGAFPRPGAFSRPGGAARAAAESMFKSAGAHGPAANRRRWMTLPKKGLATIQEIDDADDSRGKGSPGRGGVGGGVNLLDLKSSFSEKGDSMDTEIVLHLGEKKKSRQMRVPLVEHEPKKDADNGNAGIEGLSAFLDSLGPPPKPLMEKKFEEEVEPKVPEKQRTVATDDGAIELAGTAFLDRLGKDVGFGLPETNLGREERKVGSAHHRKTRSRCSIDWTLPPTDTLLEKEQHIEQINRKHSGKDMAPPIPLPLSPLGSFREESSDSSDEDDTAGNISPNAIPASALTDSGDHKKVHPLMRPQNKGGKSASQDGGSSNPPEVIVLPDFADRISSMKNEGGNVCGQRWWPYVYEVIVYQWVSLLDEQTKKGEAGKKSTSPEYKSKHGGADSNSNSPLSPSAISGLSPIVVKYLSHAAKAARGATIRCAPYLLDIITQSLSWRVDMVFRERKKKAKTHSLDESTCEDAVPPLVKLDENMMLTLEKLIIMLTDASVDSRNFDSFEYRKISIDVNDAVVRFIRDLFSILDVQLVHRLVLVYFSRFVTKEGKHWHDRDSKVTGLRCSWETTKLRLNAITLFVRFPGFLPTCAPIMESLALPAGSSADSARRFFSDALEKISRLSLSEFTAPDGPVSREPVKIPRMKPHWLAELCTDVCLSATGHAEEIISFRASSLLFELFWRHSQQGRRKGDISVVASVFVPFVPKILSNIEYLSSLPAKGQLRKDILPCTLFVMQSAPVGLMRALWRKLAKRSEGKTLRRDSADKYGGILGNGSGIGCNVAFSSLLPGSQTTSQIKEDFEMDEEPDIFDMFGLLNLSLSTIEYEGSGNQIEESNGAIAESDEKMVWRREFLLSSHAKKTVDPRSRPLKYYPPGTGGVGGGESDSNEQLTTNDSRRWHAHDCSMVIINICRQIVREILAMLKPNLVQHTAGEESNNSEDGGDLNYTGISGSRSLSDIFLQPTSSSLDDSDSGSFSSAQHEDGRAAKLQKRLRKRKLETLTFAVTDTIVFVRAAASVYLHALSMKQSDVVITNALNGAVDIVKIFGIKLFLSALGETLQHWLRVILEHCGARRQELRRDACEFMHLLLRLTWESYGSFSRVRLPLLAVQSEVMERIVAKASRKYAMEQRRLGLNPIALSNDSAEASLTPLWRTIDRLHNQSSSTNLSFKSALARLAIKMKNIYRAYLAAHALAIVNRSELGSHGNDGMPSQPNPYVQRMRVSVHRVVSSAAWFSKRFLGNQTAVSLDRSMIQTEAVEDSFLIAADVFSSTELPSHRVAWLQTLADFHRMRGRFAEEATCRCMIYHTYREAAKQHDHIWSSSPFLPWASNSSDGTHSGGEGHAIVSDTIDYEVENLSAGSGKQMDRLPSFRRIFYRAADSVRVRSGDWGAVSGGKYLFYGVTLKSEFDSVSPWYSYREMEENMVAEAEISGDLYLRAGIVESSRYCWSLANQFYSETFNYARLAYVYRRLALVVTSQVPIIDVSNQLDLSSQIGRFYKVYFHGGAPDDLLHSQGQEGFIYRVPNSVKLRDFASRLENAVRCILPNKTTIDLLLDDGTPTQAPRSTTSKRNAVIGGAPIVPLTIKVTPLRPLFKIEDNEKCFRGTPEWFQLKTEEHEYEVEAESARNTVGRTLSSLQHQRSTSTSTSNSFSSVGSVTMLSRRSAFRSTHRKSSTSTSHNFTHELDKGGLNGELIGVDRFYFTQPIRKDPVRGFRDWLKVPKGRIAERSLRVTELQVVNCFPACITRQKIIHRAVFTQSPLEASVEAVSTWCSVLFRTIIATNGQGVLGNQRQQGLSADSAKLVMESIHSSGVKRIGLTFLTVNTQLEDTEAGMYRSYETLEDEEIERVQRKLARMIVTFLELLHLLIARNRDMLLIVLHARKRNRGDASSVASGSVHGGYAATTRAASQSFSPMRRNTDRNGSESTQGYMYERSSSEIVGRSIIAENHVSHGHFSHNSDRTDSAIGVQTELQRGLVSLVKSLSSNLLDTLNNEVPRWMKSCCQENYFKTGLYRQADIPIGEELFFNVDTSGDDERGSKSESSYAVPRSIIRGSGHTYRESSPNGSLCSGGTSDRHIERTLSTTSELPPTDRSTHRRNASGTSYASLKSRGAP